MEDQLLASWLLESMPRDVLTQMLDCSTARESWKMLAIAKVNQGLLVQGHLSKGLYKFTLTNNKQDVDGKDQVKFRSIFFKSKGSIIELVILFSRMNLLRLLNCDDEFRFENDHIEYCIPKELRYLKWDRFPLEFVPFSKEENKLIGLQMCQSNLKQFWLGKMHLEDLKFINLNHSQKLLKTPNFAEIPNLERLELEGCTSLINIHPSIFNGKKLYFLNLKDCINLTNLPSHINIKALQVLILSGCSKLKNFPQFSGNTDKLLQLHLDKTSIARDIIRRLFLWCFKSSRIGIPLLANLYSLTRLNLSNCNLKAIPEGIDCLISLTDLNLSFNNFSQLPTTISQLHNLKRLNINRCQKLLLVPVLPPKISRVMLKDCISLRNVPNISKVEHLYSMTELNLINCYQLADNKGLHRLIISWMEKMLFRNGTFNTMIPGSEIPDWFTTKVGSSVSVEWDPNAPNANLIRFALCVVCGPSDDRGVDRADVSGSIIASVNGKNYENSNLKKGDLIVNGFTISGMKKLDHIWLFVLPRTKSLTRKINRCREIEFRFVLEVNYRQSVSTNIKLKKCGVGLINMEEQEEAMKRYASYIICKNKMKIGSM